MWHIPCGLEAGFKQIYKEKPIQKMRIGYFLLNNCKQGAMSQQR